MPLPSCLLIRLVWADLCNYVLLAALADDLHVELEFFVLFVGNGNYFKFMTTNRRTLQAGVGGRLLLPGATPPAYGSFHCE